MKCDPFRNRLLHLAGLCVCAALSVLNTSAQVVVSGVSDKGSYNDRASFTVTPAAGFDAAAMLDGTLIELGIPREVTQMDHHELVLWATNRTSQAITNLLLRFNVVSSEREGTETGLPPWTPYPPIPSSPAEMAATHIRLLAPAVYPVGMPIPVVAWIENETGDPVRVNGTLESDSQPGIRILRGVGSGFLGAAGAPGSMVYSARLKNLTTTRNIQAEDSTWVVVPPGQLGTIAWPENSRIFVQGDLSIAAGATVTAGAGTVIKLAPGATITLNGTLLVNGTAASPVAFAPAQANQPWGGFNLQSSTSSFVANYAIFTGSGADPTGTPQSHRNEQCLFFMDNHSKLALTNCAAISLAGQFGHGTDRGQPWNSVAIVRTLVQGCTTGGEWNGSAIQILQSAIIEVPAVTPVFNNGDEDGIYFTTGQFEIRDSLIGWTRDDGIDAGSGGSGTVLVSNTWVEATYHEAFAWSGGNRVTTNLHTVSLNCGQGIECGYSTTANSPNDYVDDCVSIGNATGIRFGDNYDWEYNGFIRVTNSIVLYNHRDVWGVNWDDWAYRTHSMDIQGNYLSQSNPNHPNNSIWQPGMDGARLAAFMSTPPEAAVGVGLATWSRQLPLGALTNTLAIGLSSFTTNNVSVDYILETPEAVLAEGTVTMAAGQAVKQFQPLPSGLPNARVARLTLSNPTNAEITGISTVWFFDHSAPSNAILIPEGATWLYLDSGTNAGTAWRALDFDDSGWKSGAAELGYGDAKDGHPEVTTLNFGPSSNSKYITYYFRHTFQVSDPLHYTALLIRLKRDDGGIVYLNGKEVFRSNMPDDPVNYLTEAADTAADDGTLFFSTSANASGLASGQNVIAVEIHQDSPTSSDISFDLQLEATLPPELGIVTFGSDWYLTWNEPTAILEAADEVTGPWSSTEAASPALIDRSAAKKFFRLRLP